VWFIHINLKYFVKWFRVSFEMVTTLLINGKIERICN